MTVRHNIAFPLHNERLPEEVVEERVVQTARLFNIDRLLNRKPRELSGGERQRVALARAMIRQPLVFLLDEPLSNLDVSLRSLARTELRLFQRKLAVTTVFVTHDQVDAMSMGDRIAVMADGRIRQIGPPQELYNRPADTFVATFLGSPAMNLVDTDSCIVGFRPEHLHIADDKRDPGNALTAPFSVQRIEYLGARLLLYGSIKGLSGPTQAVASLPSSDTRALDTGQSYDLAVDRENISYFNKHTQLRMSAPAQFARDGVVIA
jgi:multiple sugar transport system ATP-binding protein